MDILAVKKENRNMQHTAISPDSYSIMENRTKIQTEKQKHFEQKNQTIAVKFLRTLALIFKVITYLLVLFSGLISTCLRLM